MRNTRYTLYDANTSTSATIEQSEDGEQVTLETVHIPDAADLLLAAGMACCGDE